MNEQDLYRRVGKAIADRRNELELTQEDVSRRVNLSRGSLANIETGRQKILLHHLYQIAEVLEVPRVEGFLPTIAHLTSEEPAKLIISGDDELTSEQRTQVEAFFVNPTSRRSRRTGEGA